MLAPSQIPKRRSRAGDRIAAKAAMNPKVRKSPVALPQKQEQPKMRDPTEHFACATELLRSLLKNSEVTDRFDPHQRANTRMVYTKGVTLWMLMLQRLGNGLSLEATVQHVLTHDRDLLPDNKRVRDGTLSKNSSSFQKARTTLPLASIHEFSSAVCDYLGSIGEPIFGVKRVFILDGTTITLPPTPALKIAFPPATNQFGESVWPVAMLMVAHELRSGCALLPQIDPMYGPNRSSEAKQCEQIVGRLPEESIVMADSGFGIFSVVYHCTQANHQILFRLTKSRFGALVKDGKLINESSFHKSYSLRWKPSAKDRKSVPNLAKDAVLEVVLHEVELDNGTSMYLVSTVDADANGAAELYLHRYDVEFDIRDIKVTMDTENILAQSLDMVLKELYTSIVAYNLVVQFRRQAAKLARVEPRRLSFTGVWLTFRYELLQQNASNLAEWTELYTVALIAAGNRKLPNRSVPREYPRRAHPRRQKTTKFMKLERKTNVKKTEPTTPIPLPLVPK